MRNLKNVNYTGIKKMWKHFINDKNNEKNVTRLRFFLMLQDSLKQK